MFGIYPAGILWVRRFISAINAAEIRERLVNKASFTAGTLIEPFGKGRGPVIASHQGFLVMVETDLKDTDIIVVPDVQLQNLLWSMNSGFSSQWSDREIKLLTGHSGWDDLLQDSNRKLAFISNMVEQAIDGRLLKPQSSESQQHIESFTEEPWIPADYDNLVLITEGGGSPCVH